MRQNYKGGFYVLVKGNNNIYERTRKIYTRHFFYISNNEQLSTSFSSIDLNLWSYSINRLFSLQFHKTIVYRKGKIIDLSNEKPAIINCKKQLTGHLFWSLPSFLLLCHLSNCL